MKNTKWITIFTLPIMWTLYFAFEIITGRVTDWITFIGNIGLIILFILVGYILYKLSNKFSKGLSSKQLIFMFFMLMIIDQGSKLIIKLFYFNNYKDILKGFLSFNPIINTEGSWLNARFGTGISFPLLIFINVIALILFLEIYRYYKSKENNIFETSMCFIFLFCGALCSLIDKIFYGGSLDFIGVGDLFIADIKDIYINLGILYFILTLYKTGFLTSEEDTTLKEDLSNLKLFIRFMLDDIKTFFNK